MANPSFISRHGSKLAVGGLGVGGYFLYTSMQPPKPKGHYEVNPLRTPGVKNVEGAYQRGGATSTHTKAYGGKLAHFMSSGIYHHVLRPSGCSDRNIGTQLGKKDDVPVENLGTGRPRGFTDARGMGDEQRPDGSRKTKIEETFDDMKYGNKSDK
jgi:hypothetical protein